MRVGDLVKVKNAERTEGREVCRIVELDHWDKEKTQPYWVLEGWPEDAFDEGDIEIVTVADAFELAGHPVPEGAKLGFNGNEWFVLAPAYLYFDEEPGMVGWGNAPLLSKSVEEGIDQSRLPVADAINQLPEPIRKSLEELK